MFTIIFRDMSMNAKKWLIGWLSIVLVLFICMGAFVYIVDPFFHYHKPLVDKYYYVLDNERSQNDGISKYFDYDAIITGTSMTQNFKTSELDELFGVNSVKLTYSGASYKEINEGIEKALINNPNLRIVVRGLDVNMILDDKDKMRYDLGEYPTYLYDKNPFNDVKYLLNKDIIFERAYKIVAQKNKEDFTSGITTFDDYSRWNDYFSFGVNSVYENGTSYTASNIEKHLSDEDIAVIEDNIAQNVTSFVDDYPNVEFYYFITPFSVAWWKNNMESGNAYQIMEAEKYAIEMILEHDNIKLFFFDDLSDVTCDLNNYRDVAHYGGWINSLILYWMKNGEHQLTKENYMEYIDREIDLYTNFDYNSLADQEDYDDDTYIESVLNEKYRTY